VLHCLQNGDGVLQIAAIQCLIQYCLIEKNIAIQYLEFLTTLMDGSSGVKLQEMAVKALFDLMIIHGYDYICEVSPISTFSLF
jgi:hypothetical protein